MNENIYLIPDRQIIQEAGKKIAEWRIKQEMSQSDLAVQSGISLSSVQKIERGESTNFALLLSVLRTLRKLENLEFLIKEEEPSPMELYLATQKKQRKHAPHKSKKQ